MNSFLSRFLRTKNSRLLSVYRRRLSAIGGLEKNLQTLDDESLRQTFIRLRERGANGETADSLLNEVFATTRETARRVLGLRHFDEQLIGGMVLFDGNIAEMKTGEGKTLAATLPVCLQAAIAKSVHLVTVNDYLARRDADWMGGLYRFLGLSTGVNIAEKTAAEKNAAYLADVIYGTNNEFGFDYLRDNMRYDPEARAQRELNFAIVDEVDSILIDESRTPLIISGEADDNLALYQTAAEIAKQFTRDESPGGGGGDEGDFTVDEKTREIHLTESGFRRAEELFAKQEMLPGGSLYDVGNLSLVHHLNSALRARCLFLRDRDYVVQDGQVIIVDEFTGRLMSGRRWGDGQHQAVEAKEGVTVQKENQTLASTSFQNYFRLYDKLAGMTGTATTEAEEFEFIYGLKVVEIPTHRKMIRGDELDKVYRTARAKEKAILEDIRSCRTRRQPVLVGTTAIEDSEKLSARLAREKLPHSVLNAKQHEREAHVIEQAGVAGNITIATNMAGRGTDIVLGGSIESERRAILLDDSLPDKTRRQKIAELEGEWQKRHDSVLAAGGLRIIGTERHESRRIDNQLRGRAGRQGDTGSSIFYLSFEDSLLRIFATERVSSMMKMLKIDEDEAIEAKLVSRTIENAQRKVEHHNFDIRRQLLEYDDIANEQRRIIYEQREHILTAGDSIGGIVGDLRRSHLRDLTDAYLPPQTPEEEWRFLELEKLLAGDYRLHIPLSRWLQEESDQPREYFAKKIVAAAEEVYEEKTRELDGEQFEPFLRSLTLNILDEHWRAHLSALDGLRLSIGLRGMAQKNPKQEYKREAFEMFERLLEAIKTMLSRVLYALTIKRQPPPAPPTRKLHYQHADSPPDAAPSTGQEKPLQTTVGTVRHLQPRTRRNDPCPCGSGKKYKKCCGKL